MRNIISYEKDIKFDTKISEITSISLEHEEDFDNEEIEGNFIITGDYKIHQISVNKEPFKFKIPFTVELSDTIDKESIELDINDFTYDIKDNDTLNVKIDLLFDYEEKEVEITPVEVEEIEERVSDEELDEQIEELINNQEEEKLTEEIKVEEETKEEHIEESIITNQNNENTYVTYHVYMVSKEDTLDSICLKYKVDKDILHEYNDFDELSVGDKLLIPLQDE